MEMRRVLELEGRDAKNLIAYSVSNRDELGGTVGKMNVLKRKPPPPPPAPPSLAKRFQPIVRHPSPTNGHHHQHPATAATPRVRSASTGRDKRSELQARYWALLFGNLQRAISEIYATVECYENLSSCQETILVLENYCRDFRALADWFKVSWDYETRPAQQKRGVALTWDVRKSNPTSPRLRARSLSSPNPPPLHTSSTASGKSSPLPPTTSNCYSGQSSPCPTIDELPINSVTSCQPTPTEPADADEVFEAQQSNGIHASSVPSRSQFCQTDLDDENLTLIQWRQKYEPENYPPTTPPPLIVPDIQLDWFESTLAEPAPPSPHKVPSPTSAAAQSTVSQLNDMETQFLRTELRVKATRNADTVPVALKTVQARVDTCLKKPQYASVVNRLATSSGQPRAATTPGTRPALKPTATNIAAGSAISKRAAADASKPGLGQGTRFGVTARPATVQGRASGLSAPPSAPLPVAAASASTAPPVAAAAAAAKRFPTSRSKTMIELPNSKQRAAQHNLAGPQRLGRISREDIASSSSTLRADSSELIGSRGSLAGSRTHLQQQQQQRSSPLAGGGGMSNGHRQHGQSHLQSAAVSQQSQAHPPKSQSQPPDADGWLTVKVRRRSSLHWANRFNQPTGYASLPSLALQPGDEPVKPVPAKATAATSTALGNKGARENNRKQVKSVATSSTPAPAAAQNGTAKLRPAASTPPSRKPKPLATAAANVPPKTAASSASTTTATKSAAPKSPAAQAAKIPSTLSHAAQRQKSDLTGLKLATLRREYMRTANRNKTALTLSSFKATGSSEAASTTTRVPSPLPPGDDHLLRPVSRNAPSRRDLSVGSSCCDEAELRCDAADLESDEDQRKLLEEQESLERQIAELQNTEIDVDTETDETDCETIHEDGPGVGGDGGLAGADGLHLSLGTGDYLTSASVNGTSCPLAASPRFDTAAFDSAISLEARYQLLLSDMSQGERTETLATLRAFVARHPGRAQELHQKLSSPSRRRSLHETLKLYQAKHARAQEKRDALCREKAHKIQVLLARVEDVKAAKQQLIEEKRLRMEERLQRAAENRTQYLRDKIRKAHDEEEKMREIAFIKSLEAQNKRLDFMDAWREQEGRLQDLEQERQKRVEEKAAKEAAVEKRRLELELERQRRLEKMNETRREREQRIGEMQEKREKLRQQVARDKARDREERLLALQVQQQHSTEELQRKIIQKQQESARRHEENIEHIRQRALELSIPGSRQADEAGGQVGKADGAANGGATDNDLSSLVSDVSREYTSKSTKKRLKKITQKLQQRTDEYMADMDVLPAYVRNQSDVPRLLGQIRKGGGPQGLERPLNQLMRCIDKTQTYDYQCFWLCDGLGVLANRVILPPDAADDVEVTRKAQVIAVQLYRKLCLQCTQLARHAVLGNSYATLCEALLRSLQTPAETAPGQPVELSTELMIACIAPFPASLKKLHAKVLEQLPLVISYVVATGLVDTMARRLLKIRESVENHGSVILSLLATIGLLTKFGDLCPKGGSDLTKFLATIRSTDLLGAIALLHSTVIPVGECIPPRTVSLAAAAFRLLVTIANLDLAVFQDVLSDESLAFQLLDVATVLLTYCGPKATDKGESSAVIVDMIATLGFFCANNPRNQNRLTSEQSASIVKALAKLPKDFEMIVYPTLITVITDNASARQVIARDFDVTLLEEYKRSTLAQNQRVVSVLSSGGGGGGGGDGAAKAKKLKSAT